jgi:hypothetical protein
LQYTVGLIFGVLISQIASIIKERDPNRASFNKKMAELNLYLNQNGYSSLLKDNAMVINYYYFIFTIVISIVSI